MTTESSCGDDADDLAFRPQRAADIIKESPSNSQQISGLLGGTMQIVFDFIAGDIPKSESGWTVLLISAMSRRRLLLRIDYSMLYTGQ